jgi:hypothetical protein
MRAEQAALDAWTAYAATENETFGPDGDSGTIGQSIDGKVAIREAAVRLDHEGEIAANRELVATTADRDPAVVRDPRREHGFELQLRQEPDLAALLDDRRVDELARVRTGPAAPQSELEDRVQGAEDVPRGLRRRAGAAEVDEKARDVDFADPVERLLL